MTGCDFIDIELTALSLVGTSPFTAGDCTLFDIGITQCSDKATPSIFMQNCSNMKLENVRLHECGASDRFYEGVVLDRCTDCLLQEVDVYRCAGSICRGYRCKDMTNCTLRRCTAKENDGPTSCDGFLLTDATSTLTICGNLLEECLAMKNTSTITSNNGDLYHWCHGAFPSMVKKGTPKFRNRWYILNLSGKDQVCRRCHIKYRMTNLFRHLQRVSIYNGRDKRWGVEL